MEAREKRFDVLLVLMFLMALFPLLVQADSTVGEWPNCKDCAARAADRKAKVQPLVSTAKAKAASTVQSGSAGSGPAQDNPPKP